MSRTYALVFKSYFCPDEGNNEQHQDYRYEGGHCPSAGGQPPYSTTGKPVRQFDRLTATLFNSS